MEDITLAQLQLKRKINLKIKENNSFKRIFEILHNNKEKIKLDYANGEESSIIVLETTSWAGPTGAIQQQVSNNKEFSKDIIKDILILLLGNEMYSIIINKLQYDCKHTLHNTIVYEIIIIFKDKHPNHQPTPRERSLTAPLSFINKEEII